MTIRTKSLDNTIHNINIQPLMLFTIQEGINCLALHACKLRDFLNVGNNFLLSRWRCALNILRSLDVIFSCNSHGHVTPIIIKNHYSATLTKMQPCVDKLNYMAYNNITLTDCTSLHIVRGEESNTFKTKNRACCLWPDLARFLKKGMIMPLFSCKILSQPDGCVNTRIPHPLQPHTTPTRPAGQPGGASC